MGTVHKLPLSQGVPTMNSEIANARLALGEAAEAEEKWGLALEHYGIALSLRQRTQDAIFSFQQRAHCLNALGLYSEGESYCRRAIDIDPRLPEAYKNLAISAATRVTREVRLCT
jgi:tetratricopeptide (TPR) repeat protein